MLTLKAILFNFGAFVAGAVVFSILHRTMLRIGHARINFAGRMIPTSLGLGFVLLSILMCSAHLVLSVRYPGMKSFVGQVVLLCCGFGMLGLLDDIVQTREAGGFRGHLSRVGGTHEVSTALIKAAFGLLLSLLVAMIYWWEEGAFMAIVDGLIVALSANAINLLDVRPGRAVKGFLAATGFIVFGSLAGAYMGFDVKIFPVTWVIMVPFMVWAVNFALIDFKCLGMMGDAGSNVLGAMMGLLVVWELSITIRWVVLALLIAFHLMCEIVSFTEIIEKVRVLKWMDRLGIRQPRDNSNS
ncbi:MAG TPA: hypothetical protein PLN69_06065 [bacterium]|nr:hypothetical protein [bacterium]